MDIDGCRQRQQRRHDAHQLLRVEGQAQHGIAAALHGGDHHTEKQGRRKTGKAAQALVQRQRIGPLGLRHHIEDQVHSSDLDGTQRDAVEHVVQRKGEHSPPRHRQCARAKAGCRNEKAQTHHHREGAAVAVAPPHPGHQRAHKAAQHAQRRYQRQAEAQLLDLVGAVKRDGGVVCRMPQHVEHGDAPHSLVPQHLTQAAQKAGALRIDDLPILNAPQQRRVHRHPNQNCQAEQQKGSVLPTPITKPIRHRAHRQRESHARHQ